VRIIVKSDGNEGLAETQPAAPAPADPTRTSQPDRPVDSTRTSQPDRPAASMSGAPRPPMAPQLRDQDRYDILGEHGRGGLGRVSRAHDRELGRDIAIKELILRGHLGEVRFLREALITARLEHPGIVPVYEAGRWSDGTPFYAMKLVSGRPLRDLLAERKTVDERIGLLHHVIAVADAIAYAHGRGIIHRDLKPSNVIVGEFGETVVIDWGLAKDLTAAEEPAVGGGPFREHRDDGLTSAGTVLGTPAYMAPEQARGEPVDQRADVFAIGTMLWELCSLQKLPPGFSGQRRSILRKSGIDPDLLIIIEKAVAADPARRYPDASALAADLKAFKAGARIAARRYSPWGMLIHWIRRHRTLAFSVYAVLAIAVTSVVLYIWRISAERDRADAALEQTAAAKDALVLEHAELLLHSDPTTALAALDAYHGTNLARAQRVSAEARGRGVAHIINAHSDTIHLLAGLPDGSVLSVGEDRRIAITRHGDVATLAHDVAVPVIATYSHPRGLLAYGSVSSGAILLDPRTHTTTQLSATSPYALSFSDDGSHVAMYDKDSAVTLWTTESPPRLVWRRTFPRAGPMIFSGKERMIIPIPTGFALVSLHGESDTLLNTPATSFDVSPRHLAVGEPNGSVSVYEIPSLHLVGSMPACREQVNDIRLIPQRTALVFACHEGSVGIAEYLPAPVIRERFATQGEAGAISTSEDGNLAIILSTSRIAYIHDLESQLTYHYEGQASLSCAAAPASANSQILTGDINGTIRSWHRPPRMAHVAMRGSASILRALISPDTQLVAAGSADGVVSVLRLSDGTIRTNRGHTSYIEGVRFTAEGLLLSYGFDGRVILWRPDDLTVVRRFEDHHARVEDVRVLDHENLILSVGDDGRLLSWSPYSHGSVTLFKTGSPLTTLELLASDDTIVVADALGSVWHVRDQRSSDQIRHPDGDLVTLLRASPDGHLLAVGTDHGDVIIYDSATWNILRTLKMNGTIRQGAFTADGSRLILASERESVRLVPLWPALSLRWQTAHIDARDVSFSPDGELLTIVCSNGATWFYSFSDDRWVFTQDHFALSSYGRFSSDGRLFVTSDDSGIVVVRDVQATLADHDADTD
jgi:WD40 repeat protein